MRIAEQIAAGLAESTQLSEAPLPSAQASQMHNALRGISSQLPALKQLVDKIDRGPSGLIVGDVPKVTAAAQKFTTDLMDFFHVLKAADED